jgi:hypothetical protein
MAAGTRQRRSWRRWPLILPAGVLLLAVLAQGGQFFRKTTRSRGPHLAATVPTDLAGWVSRDVPLGANEFLANEAGKVLNYDEFVYRAYNRAGEGFTVYVAYWGPGKMPVQLVASHTPDRCWTENGWRCLSMRFKQTGLFAGAELQPAEWRLFEPPLGGRPTYVLYWHLVGGRPYDYGERFNSVPDPIRWWRGAVEQMVRGNREQYFIRLTSDQPLESLWAEPGFREIVRNLAGLGQEPRVVVPTRN